MNSSKSDQQKQANHKNNDNALKESQTETAIKTNKIQTEQYTQPQQAKEAEETDETETKIKEQKNEPPAVLPDGVNSDKLRHEKDEQALKLKLKKVEMDLFNKVYSIREITSSDYDDIFALCDETDLCQTQFFSYLHDEKCLFYGCVCQKTTKIIASVAITVIDGGYTAFILTLKIDSNHKHNNMASVLTQRCIDISLLKYPSLHRFRCTHNKQAKCNRISTLFADKIGFQSANIRFIYHSLTTAKLTSFEHKLTKINAEYTQNNAAIYNGYLANFEQLKCRDIDNIICILLYYYKQSDIFIDWKVFDVGINTMDSGMAETEEEEERDNDGDIEPDIEEEEEDILGGEYEVIHNEVAQINLNELMGDEEDLYEDDMSDEETADEEEDETVNGKYDKDVGVRSITDFKSYLFDCINCGDINVYGINANDMNQENGALCFRYRNTKIRQHCTFYHIFGNNEIGILSMIYSCYYLWKRSVYDHGVDGKENVYFFVNQDALFENPKLKWLLEDGNEACIWEKCVHADSDQDDDINNNLIRYEE